MKLLIHSQTSMVQPSVGINNGFSLVPTNNVHTLMPDKMTAILQMTFSEIFLEWQSLYFDSNFTEVYSWVFSWQ